MMADNLEGPVVLIVLCRIKIFLPMFKYFSEPNMVKLGGTGIRTKYWGKDDGR